jgi:hypothetical protein
MNITHLGLALLAMLALQPCAVFGQSALKNPAMVIIPESAVQDQTNDASLLLRELAASNIKNAYLPFARYALGEAAKREALGRVRSAVLVKNASLLEPKAIDCANKPLAAIIDLDVAPDTPAQMDVERQNGFAVLLQAMRDGDITIVWLAEASEARLKPITDLLREGDAPVMRDEDMVLIGLPKKTRKQERRWQLAQSHCVVAIAGDQRSDFDELYQYLRDQSYAIRLEAFMGKGWFELPHPVAAIDSERLEIGRD